MIIQSGMNIKIRTEEERDAFIEVARREGHVFRTGTEISISTINCPAAISVGYRDSDVYPKDLSQDNISFHGGLATNVVEASQLFRNQLISKRLKK